MSNKNAYRRGPAPKQPPKGKVDTSNPEEEAEFEKFLQEVADGEARLKAREDADRQKDWEATERYVREQKEKEALQKSNSSSSLPVSPTVGRASAPHPSPNVGGSVSPVAGRSATQPKVMLPPAPARLPPPPVVSPRTQAAAATATVSPRTAVSTSASASAQRPSPVSPRAGGAQLPPPLPQRPR